MRCESCNGDISEYAPGESHCVWCDDSTFGWAGYSCLNCDFETHSAAIMNDHIDDEHNENYGFGYE